MNAQKDHRRRWWIPNVRGPQPATGMTFEERKWQDELQLRNREIEIRDREASAAITAQLQSKWTSPLVIAILGAALAGLANLAVAWKTGVDQLTLSKEKNGQEQTIEASKAESARILEAVKASDPDRASQNLNFLLDAGLIENEERRKKLSEYIKTRKGGQGVSIATAGPVASTRPSDQPEKTKPESEQSESNKLEPIPNSSPPTFKYSSGWLGGGHNQNENCAQGISILTKQNPGKNFTVVSSSEESRRDGFLASHASYNYTCLIAMKG